IALTIEALIYNLSSVDSKHFLVVLSIINLFVLIYVIISYKILHQSLTRHLIVSVLEKDSQPARNDEYLISVRVQAHLTQASDKNQLIWLEFAFDSIVTVQCYASIISHFIWNKNQMIKSLAFIRKGLYEFF